MTLLSVTDQETLATAVLQAHKFSRSSCYDCENLVQGEDFKRCVGSQTDCCKCAACKIARTIISQPKRESPVFDSKAAEIVREINRIKDRPAEPLPDPMIG